MKKLNLWCLRLLLFFLASCSSSPIAESPIRVRLAQDPESLHPLSYGNAHALQILNLVYQSLLTVNLETEAIEPSLAADLPSVTISDSLSYFTYHLRPEARWDNGKAITALDVAFSLKLLQGPLFENERWRAQYGFINDIQFSPDSLESFTLVCTGYTPEMKLLSGDFFVLPSYQYDPDGLIKEIPFKTVKEKRDSLAQSKGFKSLASRINQVSFTRDTALVKGSGPYRLVSWQNGQALSLRKKEQWWGEKVQPTPRALQAYPQAITYQIIPDDAAAVLALKAKQVDLMENIPLISFQEIKESSDLKEYYNFFSPTTYDVVFLGMNGLNPLLKDKEMRQAITHLFNVPQIIKTLQGGYASQTVGVIHPKDKAFYNSNLKPKAFDPQKAQELIKQAGWQRTSTGWAKRINGEVTPLQLKFMHRAGNSEFENMALHFQQNAKSIGIPVQILGLESSQINERLKNRDFDLYFRTLAGTPFSHNFLPLWHTSSAVKGGGNVTNFGNAQTDLLLEEIATAEDINQKASLLKELQTKMQEESNMVFLYFQDNKLAISSRIIDPVVTSLKPGYDIKRFKVKD